MINSATVEDVAVTILKALVSQTGEELLRAVLEVVLGAPGVLASSLEKLVASVLRGVVDVLEPGRLTAIIDEEYAAARAAADLQAEREL